MRTLYIMATIILMITVTANARDPKSDKNDNVPFFYSRISAGFGVGLCYDDPCEFDEDYNYGEYDRIETYGAAYGTGGNVRLTGGYMFNKFIGVELGVSDFWGLKKTQELNYQGTESTASNTLYKRSAMVVNVIPSVVLTPGFENLNPYARFGLSMGVFPSIYQTETITVGDMVTKTTGKYHGGFPLGYSAAIGLNYKRSDSFSLNAEIDCEGMNYAPNKWEIKEYTINDVDHLGDLTTKQKETEFVKNYDQSEPIPDESPNKALRKYFPLSRVSMNLGVKYMF